MAGEKLWAEERIIGGISEQRTAAFADGGTASLGTCRHIPGAPPRLHPMLNPDLLCFEGHVGVTPAPETLSDPRVLAYSVGIAQAQGMMPIHSVSQRSSAHTAHVCALPPPSHLSSLVLGLCKGANETRDRKGPTSSQSSKHRHQDLNSGPS